MLTQIDVMSVDTPLELPILGVTPKSSLLIQKISGLNPPDRSLFIGDYSQDGGLYQGRRVGVRNVVLTISLNPNPALGETVSSLRQMLYKAFIDPQVDGDYLKLVLTDEDSNEKYLVGYCEKFESDMFDVDTMCQISMLCPDPYIHDNEDTILEHSTGWVQVPFNYLGTAETGFVVRIYVTAATRTLTINNNGKTMVLFTPDWYEVGDIVIFSTISGQRSITITKPSDINTPVEFSFYDLYFQNDFVFYGGGIWKCLNDTVDYSPPTSNQYWEMVSTSIVSNLEPSSRWLELHSVDNTLRVYGTDQSDIVANIKYLKYTSAYWGL